MISLLLEEATKSPKIKKNRVLSKKYMCQKEDLDLLKKIKKKTNKTKKNTIVRGDLFSSLYSFMTLYIFKNWSKAYKSKKNNYSS